MNNWPKNITILATKVLRSTNPIYTLEKYMDMDIDGKITFLLFDGKPTNNFKSIDYNFSQNNYSIIKLWNYENMCIINSKMFINRKSDIIYTPIQHYLNLDSNIVSLFPQLLEKNKIDDGFFSLLEYIKKNKIKLSLSPYVFEDSLNSSGMRNKNKAYKCLLAFFAFDRIQLDELNSLPLISNNEDFLLADRVWLEMTHSKTYNRENLEQILTIYCLILKTYIIEYTDRKNKSKMDSKKKLKYLISFINNELGIYLEYITLLSYWYFDQTYDCVTHFFQKIQPNTCNKLKKIETMVWDLFHFLNIPNEMAILSQEKNYTVINDFVSHDKYLSEIIQLNPISRIALYKDKAQIVFSKKIFDYIDDYEIFEMFANHADYRKNVYKPVNLSQLSNTLENELLTLLDSF